MTLVIATTFVITLALAVFVVSATPFTFRVAVALIFLATTLATLFLVVSPVAHFVPSLAPGFFSPSCISYGLSVARVTGDEDGL
jgi:hypothetical protein